MITQLNDGAGQSNCRGLNFHLLSFFMGWGEYFEICFLKICAIRTSLVVQWIRLCAPNAGGPSSALDQGAKLASATARCSHAAAKTWHSQINE